MNTSMAEIQATLAEITRSQLEFQKNSEISKKEWDRRFVEMSNMFTGNWGRLVEALMRPGTIKLFAERGVPITQLGREREGIDKNGEVIEMDMVLVNHGTVVAVEVKTKCRVEDIDWHLDKLSRFKEAFHEYENWNLQGAIAALSYEEDCDRYAHKKGLWVMKCTESIHSIVNPKSFQPKLF